MAKKKGKSPWKVLLAILLGIICGTLTGETASLFGITFYSFYDLIGNLFINALKLIVVPLVAASVITGIARIGNDSDFGRLGLKIFGFYIGTSFLAILIGLLCVNVFNPGAFFTLHGSAAISPDVAAQIKDDLASGNGVGFVHLLFQLIPSNILQVFNGQMLGLIFFSILFGYAISKIDPQPQSILFGFWQGIFQATLTITDIIMQFLPLGAFCLVAKSFASSGIASLHSLAIFFFTVVAGLAVFIFIALPLLLKFVAKVNPILHFKAMAPALVTAFSTSSSSATLPVTIECVEKRAGVSNRICSLVVPLGTSINMSGSALYECVAVMFIAQVYGIELSLTAQFSVVLLSLVTSIGIAGIPSASIVAIIVILQALGLPPEGIGLLFAVDRILDMCRTTVNVFSDSCCAVLVATTEGEKGVLAATTGD
ncbi:MAG: dicarboxylate/amino acid:cation symporter [Parachlamydiaceae bacterium]